MGRREQVKRSAEEKWEILQEGLKSGNIAETCRKHGVAPNLWYRWRDEAEQGAKAALGGRSAAGGADDEQISPYLDQALSLPEEERLAWLQSFRIEKPKLAELLQQLLEEHRALANEHFLENMPVRVASGLSLLDQKIGAYTLKSQIGVGGMGSVWLAERNDGRFERQVAVKFLQFAMTSGVSTERFKREGKILGQLTHPHIAELEDAGVTPIRRQCRPAWWWWGSAGRCHLLRWRGARYKEQYVYEPFSFQWPSGNGGNGSYGGGGAQGGGNGGHGGFGGGAGWAGAFGNTNGGNGGFGGGGGAGPNGYVVGDGNPGQGGGPYGGNADHRHSGGGAGLGGAIFNDSGGVRVSNSTFTNNYVTRGVSGGGTALNGGDGGGTTFNVNGHLTVTDVTIANNLITGSGGGIVVIQTDSSASTILNSMTPSSTTTAP